MCPLNVNFFFHSGHLMTNKNFIQVFYTALMSLDKDCTYEHTCSQSKEHRDERIRDRLVNGMREELRKEVLKIPFGDMNLSKVLEMCSNYEASDETNEQLMESTGVNAMKSSYKKIKKMRNYKKKESECSGRGLPKEKHTSECKARQVKCHFCSEVGHFGHVCPKAQDKN